MKQPRFSLVIPTRERAETLRYSLQTCLEQDFEDYEIIVADNHSSPATREVVDAVASPRVKYLRANRPLAMNDNWEAAVEQATGEYVKVLGDDDGLMPFALREIDRLLIAHNSPRAIRYDRGLYTWPNILVAGAANNLRLPLDRWQHTVNGRSQIARVVQNEVGADTLPMIYNAFIHHSLIREHKHRVGRLFPTCYPDVYSGFAFGYLSSSFLSVGFPMEISGLSGKSNGVATLLVDDKNPIANEFFRLHRERGVHHHRWLPDLNLLPVHAADSFLHAKDWLFPDASELVLDRKNLIERLLASVMVTDPQARAAARQAIRATLQDDAQLLRWFDTEAPDPPPAVLPQLRSWLDGYNGDFLSLDTTPFGVRTISEAVRLATNLLGVRNGEIKYDLPTRHEMNLSREALHKQIRERDNHLQTLQAERDAARNELAHAQSQLRQAALRNLPRRLLNKLLAPLRQRISPR